MVCTADDLLGWKDFPKGLRVLLLDEDRFSAAQIKSKLEEMDCIVSTFCNENEALSAISSKPESFHVAIVEVNTNNSNGSFRFLETARDLPTIMTSNIHCLTTMMKCIALGAAEFLQKPLSEEKLRNIWQHVVHKAFNAGGSGLSKSLKPIKQTVASMLQLQIETAESENGNLVVETENLGRAHEYGHEQSAVSNKFPAPSTPQLKQGARLIDDVDCQDQSNFLIEKVSREQDGGEPKFVETTCNYYSEAELTVKVDSEERAGEGVIKEENGNNTSPHVQNIDSVGDSRVEARNPDKASPLPNPRGNRTNRKKMKVDWTPELHKRFVQAVDQLGVDQAIPSRILELMKVDGLTRHNVASHLQKYRMQRRHILPKEEDRRWSHQRDPIMAFPLYHPNHGPPTSPIDPMWSHSSAVPMWGTAPGYSTWQSMGSWPWKTYPAVQADAWGCPVMPPPQGPYSISSQNPPGSYGSDAAAAEDLSNFSKTSFNLHPADEVIDMVVKEAINKRWLPLPLGLKPPSTESVLSELHRQGISSFLLPHITNYSSC